MGINWFDFIMEAFRVLKKGGILKIAEVESRFIKIPRFEDCLVKMGFDLKAKTQSNGYFIIFEFIKSKERYATKPNFSTETVLKPCKYKKR
jgi:ribosomal RNA-processing protein 8